MELNFFNPVPFFIIPLFFIAILLSDFFSFFPFKFSHFFFVTTRGKKITKAAVFLIRLYL